MPRKKEVLIVEDNIVNRGILRNILAGDYAILEAENGKQALEILQEKGCEISLIMLDLVMPVMNGYDVLDIIQQDDVLSHIPVIVTTGNSSTEEEIKSLSKGATDFVVKPYNATVVRHRVESIIRLQEKTSLINQLEFDNLTGIYNKDFFYEYVRNILEQNSDVEYDIICSDIENFKMINERYGTKAGDVVLCHMAKQCREMIGEGELCGRISSNTFMVLLKRRDSYTREYFEAITEKVFKDISVKNIVVKYGIFEIRDRNIPVSAMCDRAEIACKNIKRKYGQLYARYDDAIRHKLMREQQITDCMEQALAEGQFVVYLQPKHDVQTGEIAGAEALVRWIHPEFGFMTPNEFIPLFEQNGFITKLDCFVWEEVCRILCKWRKEGKDFIPISVNISRMDFENLDLPEHFYNLIEHYKIPYEFLHLEVTETVYADNPQKIISVVDTLKRAGFLIEMDDFGSGYSSLNMLSDLPISVLKMDIIFMHEHRNAVNNRSILSFIFSLSKWLGLPTVAEGVETQEELESLKSMGCNLVQGYLFAKPMPLLEFEAYMSKNAKKENTRKISKVRKLPFSAPENTDFKTILVVEDIAMNRMMLMEMLSPYYNIILAENGLEAKKCLDERKDGISVVLLDLMMPVMDGFQLLQLMQEDEELCKIPVIITSEAGENSDERALELGAENYIAKPYKKTLLLHHVESAIDRSELRKLKEEKREKEQNKLTKQREKSKLEAGSNQWKGEYKA